MKLTEKTVKPNNKIYLYFVIFAVKTRESFKKVDFDQRTACGAPIRWSKYTTYCLIGVKRTC